MEKLLAYNGRNLLYDYKGLVKIFFIKYLEDFSKHKPEGLKIIIIDNAAFHSTKDKKNRFKRLQKLID